MKYIILTLALVVLLGGCVTTYTPTYDTKKTRYYDDKGRYQGYSLETPYSTRYYDSKSRYVGKSE
jgi:uncharacterized protein YceK